MPATLSTPNRDNITNYPPALADALIALYNQGLTQWLALPIAFGTADAAVLYTVPTGFRAVVHRVAWEVTVGFSGGTSSAIGVSSDATGFSTKGDILGGAGGDVAATLVAGITGGTVGAKFASNGFIVIPAGKILRYDRIVSAYTAGSGFVHAQISLLPTS